jgi:hypothetical protein
MYAMICTRPDISYAHSVTSRYKSDLGEGHWTAVKNVFKYLRRTKGMFLVYGGEEELVVMDSTPSLHDYTGGSSLYDYSKTPSL